MSLSCAILVNYGNAEDSIECIESLTNQSTPFHKIIIVDNCSLDNSYEILKNSLSNIPNVIVIKSDHNGGFSYGNNVGIKYAINNFPDISSFILINNDTIADKNMLKEFLTYHENHTHDNIGILTGNIYYFDKPDSLWFSGGRFNIIRASGSHIKKEYKEEHRISFATGCLLYIPTSVFKEAGLLREEFFMYVEDAEFCYRLQRQGYSIHTVPKVKIWHKVSASVNKDQKNEKSAMQKNDWDGRNRVILARIHYSSVLFCVFFLLLCLEKTRKHIKYNVIKKHNINYIESIKEGLRKPLNEYPPRL